MNGAGVNATEYALQRRQRHPHRRRRLRYGTDVLLSDLHHSLRTHRLFTLQQCI